MFMPLHVVIRNRGASRRVVFLHGFLGDHRDWHGVIIRLGGSFECTAVNLPGHGRSLAAPDDSVYAMDATAGSVLRTLDRLGVGRAAFVGYSMGARLALYLAVHHPGRVERLVLESGSPGLRTEDDRAARVAHDRQLAEELAGGDLAEFLDRWYRQSMFETLRAQDDVFEALMLRRLEGSPHGLAGSLRGMSPGAQPALWDRLPLLGIPALAIVGGRDEKYVQIAGDMARVCPTMRVETVDGCGHNVHAENPAEYTQRIRPFLLAET